MKPEQGMHVSVFIHIHAFYQYVRSVGRILSVKLQPLSLRLVKNQEATLLIRG